MVVEKKKCRVRISGIVKEKMVTYERWLASKYPFSIQKVVTHKNEAWILHEYPDEHGVFTLRCKVSSVQEMHLK